MDLNRPYALAIVSAMATGETAACELLLMLSKVFGGSCKSLVGYYRGSMEGPFAVVLPDGSRATVRTGEGYAGVAKIDGATVGTEGFHTAPARFYQLAEHCRSSTSFSPWTKA